VFELTKSGGIWAENILHSFPAHGSTLHSLLSELELDLSTCRTHGIAVQVCSTTPQRAGDAVLAAEPLRVLEHGAGGGEREAGGTVMWA